MRVNGLETSFHTVKHTALVGRVLLVFFGGELGHSEVIRSTQ